MNFRTQVLERLLIRLGEADVPSADLEAFAADLMHLIERITQDRTYEATLRQIVQRYANEWAAHQSRRVLDAKSDEAADLVYEMVERRARDRAVRALRRALLDALEGRERPLDDLDYFEETDS